METKENIKGKAAPESECGIFMPENHLPPVDRSWSPNYEKDRRGLYFSSNLGHLYKSKPQEEVKHQLSEVRTQCAYPPESTQTTQERYSAPLLTLTSLAVPTPLKSPFCAFSVNKSKNTHFLDVFHGVSLRKEDTLYGKERSNTSFMAFGEQVGDKRQSYPQFEPTASSQHTQTAHAPTPERIEPDQRPLGRWAQVHPKKTAGDAPDHHGLRSFEPLGQPLANQKARVIPTLRPAPIILGYWKQVLLIEEDAVVFDVQYLESEPIELRRAA